MQRGIPIIKLYNTLVVSIQTELSDALVLALKKDVANEIRQHAVRGLLVEVSGIDVFDSFIAKSIQDIALVARLMGVRPILVGLDSPMAITLVEMETHLRSVETALNLEAALEMLSRDVEEENELNVDVFIGQTLIR